MRLHTPILIETVILMFFQQLDRVKFRVLLREVNRAVNRCL